MNDTVTHLDCDTLITENETVQDCINSVLASFSEIQVDVHSLEEDVHCELSTHINLDNSDDITAVDAEVGHERVCVDVVPRIRLRDVLLQNTYGVVGALFDEGVKVCKVVGVNALYFVLKADTYLEKLYEQTKEKHQECKIYLERSVKEATIEEENSATTPTVSNEEESVYPVYTLPVERVGSVMQVAYVNELPSKMQYSARNLCVELKNKATFIEMILYTYRNFIFILRTGRTLT